MPSGECSTSSCSRSPTSAVTQGTSPGVETSAMIPRKRATAASGTAHGPHQHPVHRATARLVLLDELVVLPHDPGRDRLDDGGEQDVGQLLQPHHTAGLPGGQAERGRPGVLVEAGERGVPLDTGPGNHKFPGDHMGEVGEGRHLGVGVAARGVPAVVRPRARGLGRVAPVCDRATKLAAPKATRAVVGPWVFYRRPGPRPLPGSRRATTRAARHGHALRPWPGGSRPSAPRRPGIHTPPVLPGARRGSPEIHLREVGTRPPFARVRA